MLFFCETMDESLVLFSLCREGSVYYFRRRCAVFFLGTIGEGKLVSLAFSS